MCSFYAFKSYLVFTIIVLFFPAMLLSQNKFPENIIPDNPNPPQAPIRLMFIHHSTGGNWLANENGGLGNALRDNNYYVSDVSYGWGPGSIGDKTDLGNWWEWFRDPANSPTYLASVYTESGQNSPFGAYNRLATNPNTGGENEIIMFKSCFPNSALRGNISDAIPAIGSNPLRGQDNSSENHTIANAKGIYIDLLEYFKTRQDKLFIVITAPPLSEATYSANARAFNLWLVKDWLKDYTFKNVFVFDFYNVLTTNGGSANINDLGSATGNHHRWKDGAVQHQTNGTSNTLAYPSEDDHPNQQGNFKATAEFLTLLNVAYNRWKNNIIANVRYKISGTITLGSQSMADVSVRLTGNGKDTISVTGSNGKYEFINIPGGTYIMTPAKANFAFNPASFSISLNTDTIKDFTASAVVGVHFNDAILEAEIRIVLNKPTGDITEAEMATLTNFYADNKAISDLTGLEKAINLTNLDLNNNNISSILPLAGLVNLTRLVLYGNHISNIDSMKRLTNLTTLLIGYNPIININALSGMSNLTNLHIPAIQATSFNALSSLNKLTELQLEGNQISGITFLSNLTNLTQLYLNDNQITDLNPLANIAELTNLVLYNNQVSNISPLSNLKKLEVLYLGGNPLSNILPLSSLTALTQLYLTGNRVIDISPLSGLVNLTDLDLTGNRLSDISLTHLYPLKLLSNSNVYTNIAGEYKTGYLDLRENIGFSENAIKSLDNQLTLIAFNHILWNTVSSFYDITGIVRTGGAALSDVSIRLKGGVKDTVAITNSSGEFSFLHIPAGDIYILTPSKATFMFYPPADTLGVLLGDSTITFTAAKVVSIGKLTNIPRETALYQNYPNPFNPSTVISFQLSVLSYTTLKIYDVFGREAGTLINEFKEPGKYSVHFNAKNMASGVYYYRLNSGEYAKTMKMVYVR